MTLGLVALAIALLLLGGIMAAVDAAVASLSQLDYEHIAARSRSARSIRAISADPDTHLNAVNFVRLASETIAAVVITLLMLELTASIGLALLWSAIIMAAVSFGLVGLSPRSIGRTRAEQLVRAVAPLVHVIRRALGPVAALLVQLGNRVSPGRGRVGVSSERELLSVVDQATASDVLEEDDRQLIRSVLEFDDTVVRSVMVPRTDMVTIPAEATLGEAMAEFLRSGVSRMPVVGDDIDEIDRVLYLRDVAQRQFDNDLDGTAGSVARPAVLVPESMKLDALLRHMQRERTHIALIVDEYGGIAGLVSLEDLIEELVGDISDEYDRGMPDVSELGERRYRVSARLPIDQLGELYGLDLDDDDVDTVGGLLNKSLGRLPVAGDTVVASGLVLRAGEVIGRRRLVSVIVEPDESLRDALGAFADEGVNE
ncbi:MAG TPA: hemolysin family protein [Microbacteriaceae bacterium]|nr:hemolysin family protein [Microbacteriaceae bacterium]